MRLFAVALLFVLSARIVHATGYDSAWAEVKPLRAVFLDANAKVEQNGIALLKAVAALKPGDRLELAGGTYSVDRMWDIGVSGTAEVPTWIVAAKHAQGIITRTDNKQNVINIGQSVPVSYLCLRGIEITGGSHGIRLGHCNQVWIDQCHIHHTGEVCLSANSAETNRLQIYGPRQ